MARSLYFIFAFWLLVSCHGLELSLDREPPAPSGGRNLCGVLTCEETADASVSKATDQADSIAVFNSMSVYIRASTGPRINTRERRDVLIGSVSTQVPSLNRVKDGRIIDGLLEPGRATVRVELVKEKDCKAEFTCQVRGLDSEGREVVTSASLVQQPGQAGDQGGGASLGPAMSQQLLASLQQLITQSVNGLEMSLEDRIDQLHKDLKNRSDSFENRMEDKVLNLEKECHDRSSTFENRVSTELDQYRTDAKADIKDSLDTMGQRLLGEQREALRKVADSFERALSNASDLLHSLDSDLDLLKSYEQINLATVKNETELIREILTSGEINAVCAVNDTSDSDQVTTCYKGMSSDRKRTYAPYILTFDATVAREVLCDTNTLDGGWIVIQRRITGDLDFFKTWEEYKKGFGDLSGDFWLGNDAIHELTSSYPHELRIDMRVQDRDTFAQYDSFSIEAESDNYRLRLGSYFGTVGETSNYGLSYHSNYQFSTFDKDNDDDSRNCASTYHGAWWYRSCLQSNLNGLWGVKNKSGVSINIGVFHIYPTFTEMKVRRI